MEQKLIQNFDWKRLVDMPKDTDIAKFTEDGKAVLNFAVYTDATDSATSNVSNLWQTVILADIVRYAQTKAYFLNAVKQIVAPAGAKSIKVPITTSNLTFDEQSAALATTTYETEVRDWTEITNATTVEFAYKLYKYGAAISKEVAKATCIDLIAEAKEQIQINATRVIDTAIATALDGATPAAIVYGGDATVYTEIANGDILTTSMIADAVTELDEEGWENDSSQPYLLFINTKQKAALLKDSQFVNASEYGSNEVVATGEIGNYLGVKVIVSTRVPALSGTAATTAKKCFLVKSQVCGAIVWFEKPTLDAEYNKERAATQVYLDMSFAADSLQDKAIVFLEVSDI
jgi:N4-gp56 family major capsid protein